MQVYLVGGAVRDELLELPFTEKDWVVVGGTPEELTKQGYKAVGKSFPVFLHPKTNEEYALARLERKVGKGYTGFDCDFSPEVTLEQDLERRDLTLNAIAKDEKGELIDPYKGIDDIHNKILRHVSPAFVEDPLRVLRVARFAARFHHLGFTIADETIHLMKEIVAEGEMETLTLERVFVEMQKALKERHPAVFFETLYAVGALERLMPELSAIWHAESAVYQVSGKEVLEYTAAETETTTVRLAAMFALCNRETTDIFCKRLKIPNRYKFLLEIVSGYFEKITSIPNISAEMLLELLERSGGFKSNDVFHQSLKTSHILLMQIKTRELADKIKGFLESLVNDLTAIDVNAWVKEGCIGSEIKTRLKETRLELINAALKDFDND